MSNPDLTVTLMFRSTGATFNQVKRTTSRNAAPAQHRDILMMWDLSCTIPDMLSPMAMAQQSKDVAAPHALLVKDRASAAWTFTD